MATLSYPGKSMSWIFTPSLWPFCPLQAYSSSLFFACKFHGEITISCNRKQIKTTDGCHIALSWNTYLFLEICESSKSFVHPILESHVVWLCFFKKEPGSSAKHDSIGLNIHHGLSDFFLRQLQKMVPQKLKPLFVILFPIKDFIFF